MWAISGPILLITLVLGIIAISKGQTINGVMIVLASLTVVPVILFVAPFVSTGLFFSATAASAKAASDSIQAQELGSDASTSQGALSSVWGDSYNASNPQPTTQSSDSSQSVAASAAEAAGDTAAATVARDRASESDGNREIQSDATQVRGNSAQEDTTSTAGENAAFPFPATITDSRGEVVLQSGPGITSSNVAKLRSGEDVMAASYDGDWIMVQTQDNKMGYVRRKQLEFSDD